MVSSGTTLDSRLLRDFSHPTASPVGPSQVPTGRQWLGSQSLQIRTFTILGFPTTGISPTRSFKTLLSHGGGTDGFSTGRRYWTKIRVCLVSHVFFQRHPPSRAPDRASGKTLSAAVNDSSKAVLLNKKASVQDRRLLPATVALLGLPIAPLSKSPRPQETAPPRPFY
jgi:hypothetical protein